MFSFLKRKRSPKQRIERTVRFVGEQDGPIERRLKADLLTVLNARPNIKSPYLARVAYDNPKAQEVVLALRSVSGHDTDLRARAPGGSCVRLSPGTVGAQAVSALRSAPSSVLGCVSEA